MNKLRKDIDEAFRCYYKPLCLYTMHYLHDIDLAEDVVQDCFAELWERMNTKKVSSVRSYLYMMVKNRCLDTLKKDNLIDTNTSPSDLADIIPDEEAEERSLIEARLWTAIDTLPEKCREVFLLSKRDGLKYKEIADKLNISAKTVENQVAKAIKILKEGAIKIYTFFFG
ncbi:MAG: RNA polymerase sigma-70 factor [Mediterranea sp.]|nr:RNA polymerase sigma-70 factor [Mediterranea sp.]